MPLKLTINTISAKVIVVNSEQYVGTIQDKAIFRIKLSHIRSFKRLLDLLAVAFALPLLVLLAAVLLLLNPFLNPGPLFYRQGRMGKDGQRFKILKFRTMIDHVDGTDVRKAHDPVEDHRITRLGRVLRRLRLDEFPNFWNVVKGEMTLIGPRPDTWEHAEEYWEAVPYYPNRFRVLPGITGLAQIRGGYADNPRAIERKARFDHHYVDNWSLKLELYVIWRTIVVIFSGFGAK